MSFRGSQALCAAALVAALAALAVPVARFAVRVARRRSPRLALALESGVLQQINTIRRRHGLQPVRLEHASLTAAASVTLT